MTAAVLVGIVGLIFGIWYSRDSYYGLIDRTLYGFMCAFGGALAVGTYYFLRFVF